MSRDQRGRMLAATAEAVARHGYRETTVEQIVKGAGVSRATFYEHFANREECLLAVFDEGLTRLQERVRSEAQGLADWQSQVRAGLAAILDFIAQEPALARTCIVETMSAGPQALERYEAALQSVTPFLEAGRELAEDGEALPITLEDSIVGGVVWMLHQRLLTDEAAAIPALLPTMLEFALTPYVGDLAAGEFASGAAV
ncbi:MAG TPA: TetR/AcrR family transcriptional regulator [Solirubrobacterales bacterium]|nr:TetR/AcrR family transcriptional regulator [Solirubrobacterales bacterium]